MSNRTILQAAIDWASDVNIARAVATPEGARDYALAFVQDAVNKGVINKEDLKKMKAKAR